MKKAKITKLTLTALSLILSVNFLGGSLLCLKNQTKMASIESAKQEENSNKRDCTDKCKLNKDSKEKNQNKEVKEKDNEKNTKDNTKAKDNAKENENKMNDDSEEKYN